MSAKRLSAGPVGMILGFVALLLAGCVASLPPIASLPENAGGVSLQGPDPADNGNVVPVTVTLEQPLTAGDVLVLAAEGEEALELRTKGQPITEVMTRLRLQKGKVAAYVIRGDGRINSASRGFKVRLPAEAPPGTGYAGDSALVRSFEKRLKVKFFNAMARQGAIRQVKIKPADRGEIVARFTLRISDDPILYLTSSSAFPADTVVQASK